MKGSFLSHENAAQQNRNVVLRYIRRQGQISRTEIWEAMDISRASVTQVIRQLQEEGLIADAGKHNSGTGRSQSRLRINPDDSCISQRGAMERIVVRNADVFAEVAKLTPEIIVQNKGAANVVSKAHRNSVGHACPCAVDDAVHNDAAVLFRDW